jgi:hypothetical protein
VDTNRLVAGQSEFANQLVQLRHLILRESLGRKQIEGACRRVSQHSVQDGQVVAKCLARGGWRGDDYIAAGGNVRE